MTDQDTKAMVLSTGHQKMLTNYAKNYLAVKAIEKEMKLEVDRLKEVMIQNNVLNIDNGEYSLTLSPVNGVKLAQDISLKDIFDELRKEEKSLEEVEKEFEFYKLSLDTSKTNAHVTLTGELPAGVEKTVTYKLNAPKAV